MQITEDSKDYFRFVMIEDCSLRQASPPKNQQKGGVEKSHFFMISNPSVELTFTVGQRRNNGYQIGKPFCSATNSVG